jgi:transposase
VKVGEDWEKSLSFVGLGKNKNTKYPGGQAMPNQHTMQEGASQVEGIVVPLELAGLRILKQEVQADGKISVEVIGTNERATCPHCETICVKQHDVRKRSKRDVPLRGHRVELVLHKRRFWCICCHKAFTESDSACGRRKRTTVRLREEIGQQASTRPIAHVANHYHVGPRFVQGCFETVASMQLAKRGLSLEERGPLPTPRFLGIDEFARRKGHRYDTILCDLDARQVLEVSAGRKKEEVIGLLERLTNCDGVEAVSMDMSSPFREAVQWCLPQARIVADHFHVIQHVGKAVNKVIGRSAKKEEGKKVLDGQRHLFLRNQENLSAEEEQTRAALAAAFPEIGTAWQLKEALRTWYATTAAPTAAADLDVWIATVKRDGPTELRRALSAFRNWRQEMLAFFDFLPTRLSNGFVEGKNNRTKALMRQGYGYRNRRHLRLRILLEVA